MTGVGEVGKRSTHAPGKGNGLLQIQVRMVLLVVQGVHHQIIYTPKLVELFVGDGLHVGDVGKITNAKAQHWQTAVKYLDGLHLNSTDRKRLVFVNSMQTQSGRSRITILLFEDVGKAVLQVALHLLGSIDRHILLIPEVEGPHIVHTNNVVVVFMGHQYRIDPADLICQHLLTKVRTTIDDQLRRSHPDGQGSTQAPIARIGRLADRTVAANHRHPLRGTRPQECNNQIDGASLSGVDK